MYTLKNKTETHNWFVDLEDHGEVENYLPYNGFNIRNDSSQIAYVELEGRKVGEVQRFSSDNFSNRSFSEFRVYSPDKQNFAIDELFVQVGKDQIMSSQPFNPQWDMLEIDFDRYAQGCDSRLNFSVDVSAVVMKYWLNVANSILVQRNLSVLGSAVPGSYEIDFEGDIIPGVTPIDTVITDSLRYRKRLQNSGFDYTFTDCEVVSWMVDYKGYTDCDHAIDVDPGNGVNGYDDDLTTVTDWGVGLTVLSDVTLFSTTFPDTYVRHAHTKVGIKTLIAPHNIVVKLWLYIAGSWVKYIETNTISGTEVIEELHANVGEWCTGLKITGRRTVAFAGAHAYVRVYDVSAV